MAWKVGSRYTRIAANHAAGPRLRLRTMRCSYWNWQRLAKQRLTEISYYLHLLTAYTYTFVQEHSRNMVACKASKYSIAESCARTMALDFFQAAAALAQVSQWQAMACPQALQMYGNDYLHPVPIKIGKGLKYSLAQPCVKRWTKVLWSQLPLP